MKKLMVAGSGIEPLTSGCSVVIGTPPWENPDLHDDSNAPWNHWLHADSFGAPWNGIFCNDDNVNEYLKENGFSEKYFWK